MSDSRDRNEPLSPLQKAVLALKEMRARLDSVEQARTEPIAILGLGCRFPGGVTDSDTFWQLLHNGRDAVGEVPPGRWTLDEKSRSLLTTLRGGFLPDLDQFDALFFGIAPREAQTMDPQQRLLLEVGWEALENAGLAPDRLAGRPVGVFVGTGPNEYAHNVEDRERIDSHVLTGNAVSVAAGRVAYLLGLQGPVLALDTACSSSLVAVHLACESLRRDECEVALAGGVNVLLNPESSIALTRMQALSPEGRCKTFDASADGYVRSEGCGLVVLKRLSKALADGDPILAVVRGSAMNHDGRSAGLTVPSGPAQEAVIRRALEMARVEPSQLACIEAHGTGTPLGDPIEVRALAAVLGPGRERPLLLGSVKSNLGHLEAAAGIAGFLKMVLALSRGTIPPSLHFREPNPHISWGELSVRVVTENTPWPTDGPRLAGVSSFGFSGTNAHVILEQAPPLAQLPATPDRTWHLLTLSAHDEPALLEQARRLSDSLSGLLADIAYTLNVGRARLPHRAALVVDEVNKARSLLASLDGVHRGEAGRLRVAFVFPGEGAYHAGMGEHLYATCLTFRQELDRITSLFSQGERRGVSPPVTSQNTGGLTPRRSPEERSLFAVEVALARLWQSWGVQPVAVRGEGVGEIAAACVAGALSLEDAVTLLVTGDSRAVHHSSPRIRIDTGDGGRPDCELLSMKLESGRDEWQSLLESAAVLFVHGVDLDGAAMDHGLPRRKVALPTYPFQRQRYWIDRETAPARPSVAATWPGERLDTALRQTIRETQFDPRQFAFLLDHKVHGEIVVAGACHLALVLAALGDGPHTLQQVEFPRALLIPSEKPPRVQTVVDPAGRFEVHSSVDSSDWTLHASGAWNATGATTTYSLAEPRRRCTNKIESESFYRQLADHGVDLGPQFQWIGEVWSGEGEALCRMRTDNDDLKPLPPGLADSCVQAVILALPRAGLKPGPYIPVGVERLVFTGPASGPLWAHSICQPGTGEEFRGDVTLFEENGRVVARWEGIRYRRAPREVFLSTPSDETLLFQLHWREQSLPEPANRGGRWVLLGDESLTTALRERLRDDGTETTGIVFIADGATLDATSNALRLAIERETQGISRLWLVTRGAQSVAGSPVDPTHAPLWGLGRTLALERPELRCSCLDLDPSRPADEIEMVVRELLADSPETQVAHRGGQRFVARLNAAALPDETPVPPGDSVLETTTSGLLDSLTWRPLSPAPPAAHEVQVRVKATGLNFRDVLNALGLYPGEAGPLGLECSGVVNAVGANVTGFKVGDEVLAMASGGFRSVVNTDARLVARKPASLSFEEATALPVVFLTAHHAFANLARLQPGERVLVHAAAGGVGLAALQIARRLGAEVFATASRPKHDTLRALGVRHVFDSRSLAFEDEVRTATNGDGVHVVLNSLAGDFIPAGLRLLAPGGRFVEIGKTDIWDAERVHYLRPDVRYFTLALDQMGVADPTFVGGMLRELLPCFERGELQPLPGRVFPLRRVREAFRFMAGAGHVGKIVVTREDALFRPDATYLITGGLGALGLEVARWMVEQGARSLALTGRRAPTEETRTILAEMERAGAKVRIDAADVADVAAIGKVVAEIGPSLRGVIHAAGVLEDGLLSETTRERLERVFAPKVTGAWNLHRLTREKPLDFFVLFSSAASLLGSAGQGAYAAANAFLDALAHHRRGLGLPALSINWGPWEERGMAAALGEQQRQRWASQGLKMISLREGLETLGRLLRSDTVQVAVLPLDRSRLTGTTLPLVLSELAQSAPAMRSDLLDRLSEAPAARRLDLVIGFVRQEALRVLGLPESHPLSNQQSLNEVGLDSLLAVELRNRVGASLGRALPATLLYNYPSIEALSGKLLEELFPPAPEEPDQPPAQADVEALSESELDDLLAQFADRHLKR